MDATPDAGDTLPKEGTLGCFRYQLGGTEQYDPNYKEFLSYVDMLEYHAKTDSAQARITESAKYVLDNWSAAKVRRTNRRSLCGCSAEGHVSHVLSSRMSTAAMGWRKTGADKMAHLRAWYWNGGDMLELARYQKQVLPKAAGAEDCVLSAAQMYHDEVNRSPKWTKYLEVAINEEKCFCEKKSLTMHITRGTSARLNPTVSLRRCLRQNGLHLPVRNDKVSYRGNNSCRLRENRIE